MSNPMSDAVMVPREPTEAMLTAGYEAWLNRDSKDGVSIIRSVWSAMIAASTSVGGWEDISTAPRDGSMFLAGYDDHKASDGRLDANQRVYEARWNAVQGTWTARNGFLIHSDATHWMPLPPPPSVSTGSRPQEAVPTEQAADSSYQWEARLLNGQWRVGLKGNLDTVHDATITVHKHGEGDIDQRIAEWVAEVHNASPQPADGCYSNEGAGE